MSSLAIQAAETFAATVHAGQMYGTFPYTKHLAHVNEVLRRFDVTDEALLIAAWLHDSVEDTDTTINQLNMIFGPKVADLVYRVTNEKGKNRKERHQKTYPKIVESDEAITLKLADRIANVEHSIEHRDKIIDMYKKEYEDFREAMYKIGTHDAMWRHLDFLIGRPQVERSQAW